MLIKYDSIGFADIGSALGGGSGYGAYGGCAIVILAQTLAPSPWLLFWPWPKLWPWLQPWPWIRPWNWSRLWQSPSQLTWLWPRKRYFLFEFLINFFRVVWWVRPREQDELWCDRGQFAIAVISTPTLQRPQRFASLSLSISALLQSLTLSSWDRLSALEEGTGLDYNYNNYEHAAAAASTRNTDVVSYGTWTASVEGETTWTEKILPSIPHFSKGIHSSA